MEKYLTERLGVEVFLDVESRTLLSVFIELRNIYVHNRGVVNGLFLSRVPKHSRFSFVNGRRYHVDFDLFVLLANNALATVIRLDELLAKKFGVRRKKLCKWLAAKSDQSRKQEIG